MRLLHLSDLHFGRPSVPGQLEALARIIEREHFEVVVVSGDVSQRTRTARVHCGAQIHRGGDAARTGVRRAGKSRCGLGDGADGPGAADRALHAIPEVCRRRAGACAPGRWRHFRRAQLGAWYPRLYADHAPATCRSGGRFAGRSGRGRGRCSRPRPRETSRCSCFITTCSAGGCRTDGGSRRARRRSAKRRARAPISCCAATITKHASRKFMRTGAV